MRIGKFIWARRFVSARMFLSDTKLWTIVSERSAIAGVSAVPCNTTWLYSNHKNSQELFNYDIPHRRWYVNFNGGQLTVEVNYGLRSESVSVGVMYKLHAKVARALSKFYEIKCRKTEFGRLHADCHMSSSKRVTLCDLPWCENCMSNCTCVHEHGLSLDMIGMLTHLSLHYNMSCRVYVLK